MASAPVDERLQAQGRSLARRRASLKIAAVGRKTAQQLEDLGATADFIPPDFVADSLLENFPVGVWGQRILLPRVQSGGRTLLAEAFGEAGARVSREVAAYESRCPKDLPALTAAALEAGMADAICFSSGKTVRHTVQLLEPSSARAGTTHQQAGGDFDWPANQRRLPRAAGARRR